MRTACAKTITENDPLAHHLANLARILPAQHADYLDNLERKEGPAVRAAVAAALHQAMLRQAEEFARIQAECER